MKNFIVIATQSAGLMLSMLFSTIAVAHPGHGSTSLLSHELEHMLWISAGVGLAVYLLYCMIKKNI